MSASTTAPPEPTTSTVEPAAAPQSVEDAKKTVRDRLAANVVFDVGSRMGYLATRFFIPPFVLARIGLDAYGLWATAFVLISYLGISTIGISNVYIKYVAEYGAKGDHARANSVLATGFTVSVLASLVLFSATWLAWPAIVGWLDVPPHLASEARVVVLSIVAVFLASISLSVFDGALIGCQRLIAVRAVWVASYLLEVALIVILVGSGRGIRGLAEAFVARTLLAIGLTAWVTYRTLPWFRISPRRFSRQALGTIVRFGGTVQVLSFFAIILNSIEKAIAAPLIGLQATGLLDIGKKLPGMGSLLPTSFTSSFLPAASYLHGGLEGTSEQKDTLAKLYLKGARYMNLSAGYISAFLVTLPAPILFVWLGKEFPGAALIMVLFGVAGQIHVMTAPGTEMLKGFGRPREEFRYCLPNVALLCLLVPASRWVEGAWTTRGITVAVALSTVLAAIYFIRHANRLLSIPSERYIRRVVLPGAVPYLVGLTLLWPVLELTRDATRWGTAGVVLGAGVVYTLVLGLVVDRLVFETGERQWFHALARGWLGRLGGILRRR